MDKIKLTEILSELLKNKEKNAPKEQSYEDNKIYIEGYRDGALDLYNCATKDLVKTGE